MTTNYRNEYDVVIIGAGAAGLMAARELGKAGKSVIILEAKDRIGGRAYTIQDNNASIPIELGAEFIHGHLPVTLGLLKEARISYHKVQGSFWRFENGELKKEEDWGEDYSDLQNKFSQLPHDINVDNFLQHYLQEEKFKDTRAFLKNYVEGYDAADTDKASTFALRDDLMQSGDVQYRIDGGYGKLLTFLSNNCQHYSCTIHLSSQVTQVRWQADKVEVTTAREIIMAKKAIITVPLGVLQAQPDSANYLNFDPPIEERTQAARALGFGNVIKVILLFADSFWKDKGMDTMSFLFSKEQIPTWWTQYPVRVPILTGWLAGPKAVQFKEASEEEMLQKSIASLSAIFKIPTEVLYQQLISYYISNWITDPFCKGGYTYETVNGSAFRQLLKTPVENTLFFAGEGLQEGPQIGTVEAALVSGKQTAEQVIALL